MRGGNDVQALIHMGQCLTEPHQIASSIFQTQAQAQVLLFLARVSFYEHSPELATAMAALYNLEPQPTAKVVLNTTSGSLTIELFAKQTPLASRNFLQHCLDGYYNNTIFHRLVPGFIIQGGDPTGTGSGGEAAINGGDVFEDEFHSRLKFNRRGLLGMANEGPNTNGSQFFVTLGVTAELQGKNTMFGRVEGDTIYNLMKMGEAEMTEGEGSERPLYPTKITGVEVLVNPFEDMVVRAREAPREENEEKKKEVKKRKKPAGKNVLSFGGEEGESEAMVPVAKKAKVNPKLVVVEEEGPKEKSAPKKRKEHKTHVEMEEEDEEEKEAKLVVKATSKSVPQAQPDEADDMDVGSDPEEPIDTRRNKRLESTNAQIAALKASMKRTIDPKFQPKKEKPKSALESLIPETSIRGRKRGKVTDERGAIDLFRAFKQRLETLPADTTDDAADGDVPDAKPASGTAVENEDEDEEALLCDLHFIANCQSCKKFDEQARDEDEGDGVDGDEWMAHKLSFKKDTLGKDLEWKRKMEEIEVIDPREKARAIKEESMKKKGKGKGKVEGR